MKKFKFHKQLNKMDCGPCCLRMVAKFYGKDFSLQTIRKEMGFAKDGVSLLGLREAARQLGFDSEGVSISYEDLFDNTRLPAILHWGSDHFVVLIGRTNRRGKGIFIKIADPAKSIRSVSESDFLQHWPKKGYAKAKCTEGYALVLSPSPAFSKMPGDPTENIAGKLILSHFKFHKWKLLNISLIFLASAMLQLLFPFLTQSMVDNGINAQNLSYITIILIAQLVLTISRTFLDFLRGRMLLWLSSVINLSMLSDFWIKMTKLPISYFDSFHVGDTMQRLNDNKDIQRFITGSAVSTLFSLFNLVLFSIVLLRFHVMIFMIFCAGSILYFGWIKLFLGARRRLNYDSFNLFAQENNSTMQMVHGMQEIKLHGAEQKKRWEWENIQAAIFKLSLNRLSYSQTQQYGALMISQLKDILISFIVARLVVSGEITLGTMIAIQYVLAQLNSPVEQLISFVQSAQDAKISLERLNDIHQIHDEELPDKKYLLDLAGSLSIRLENFSFGYPGNADHPVLRDITFQIPEGKTTAIVGMSGSGKSTLIKILLKFHESYTGSLTVGGIDLRDISPTYWRSQCGAVLQESYIFNDSIANNIAISGNEFDYTRMINACRVANILEFVESLPNGFDTKLGTDGTSLSQGQKQRLFIAREVYKDCPFVFFDEATNALDANNEKIITENLDAFFNNKTVVVIAHRLSTIKKADKIIVLDNGKIAEQGTHEELKNNNHIYLKLVENQLDTK